MRATLAKPLVMLAAAGAVTAACSSTNTSSPSTIASTTIGPSATTTVPATLRAGDRYVALGSSIASGFGISVQSTPCGRSNRNYPNLVAQHYELKLTDVTCGAAVIPNVLDTPQAGFPPQIDALTPDTKLVTVTVGGNDIVYNATAVSCRDPAYVCKAPADLEAKLSTTRTALATMLDKIAAAAPSAKIVFVTYPREVGETNCAAYSFTDEEADIVGSMGRELEELFVTVADRPGATFVDPYVAPGDHTGCAPTAQRWTAGAVADDGFAYHPTALGHREMADMIIEQLGN